MYPGVFDDKRTPPTKREDESKTRQKELAHQNFVSIVGQLSRFFHRYILAYSALLESEMSNVFQDVTGIMGMTISPWQQFWACIMMINFATLDGSALVVPEFCWTFTQDPDRKWLMSWEPLCIPNLSHEHRVFLWYLYCSAIQAFRHWRPGFCRHKMIDRPRRSECDWCQKQVSKTQLTWHMPKVSLSSPDKGV